MPSSARAHTIAMSATDALVIHILEPFSTQSDPSRLAVVRITTGVRPEVRFGQPEATDQFARRHSRAATSHAVPRCPNGELRTSPAIPAPKPGCAVRCFDGLQLLAHQPVRGCGRAAAAVAGQMHAEQAQLADLGCQIADWNFA